MKALCTIRRAVWIGTLLAIVCCSGEAESSVENTAGIVAAAPQIVDLGPGWNERRIVFASDPLDQPSETVPAAVSMDPSDRRRFLARMKAAMEGLEAVGMGCFGYGFGERGRYAVYVSRYPDRRILEKRWSEYLAHGDERGGPPVGEASVWVPRTASDEDFRLVFRSGLFVVQLECDDLQSKDRLVHLARITAAKMARITEQIE